MKCYHIWILADGGNAMFRRRVCYASRSTAKTIVNRGGTFGDRTDRPVNLQTNGNFGLPVKRAAMVLECDPATCHCGCVASLRMAGQIAPASGDENAAMDAA